jgi:hypothetical protein
MGTTKFNYSSSTKEPKLPLIALILVGQKWPWISKTIIFCLSIFLFPFRKLTIKTSGGSIGHLSKLIQLKKFQEGYDFGLEQLSRLSAKLPLIPEKPKSMLDFSKSFSLDVWNFVFDLTCQCAAELDDISLLKKMETIYEQYPGPKNGHSSGKALSGLAILAWKKRNADVAWEWINRAIERDDSNGYSYYFRAWMGEITGMGQPLDDLILAINIDSEFLEMVFKEEAFLKNELLLTELKERLEIPN